MRGDITGKRMHNGTGHSCRRIRTGAEEKKIREPEK
jgi:hypothetical protein